MGSKARAGITSVKLRVAATSDSWMPIRSEQVTSRMTGHDSHERLFQKLRRKYPDIDPRELKEHLAKPLELQPLWLASGRSTAMNREERADVIITHFQRCGMTFRQAASTRPLQRIFLRAIKRQVGLTFKQWQAANLTVDGLDIKEISARMQVTERMVKTHLQAVRRKAHLNRNAQIVLWFLGY